MSKIIGIQGEFNITMNDDLIKGVGKGIAKTGIHADTLFADLKSTIIEVLKKVIIKEGDKK